MIAAAYDLSKISKVATGFSLFFPVGAHPNASQPASVVPKSNFRSSRSLICLIPSSTFGEAGTSNPGRGGCAHFSYAQDDRDHYGNKRLDLAGPLLGGLFRMLFRKVTKDVRIYVQKCVDSGKEINLTYAVKAKTISQVSLAPSSRSPLWMLRPPGYRTPLGRLRTRAKAPGIPGRRCRW
eukprot:1180140-Prorocentrum_minimum.AAC.12